MPEDSDQKITLVTGANKGIGFETVRRLKAEGHKVYLGARNRERGQKAADDLSVSFIQIDVTNEASVTEAAAEVERLEGRLDVLVNNAGIREPNMPVDKEGKPQAVKKAADLTGADAQEVFDTNVFGLVRVIHAFLPLLAKSSCPNIVNVSSGMGSFSAVTDPKRGESQASVPLYSASKAAVTMLTVQYAKLLPSMRVNAADPGLTATEFTGNSGHTVTEGTDAIIRLATLEADGPSGTFVEREGTVPW